MEEDYIVCADDHVGHGKTAIENNTWDDWGYSGVHTMMDDEYSLLKITKEKYPDCSEEDLKKMIWEQIKEINKTFPPYKYIKNMILTDQDLIKTTTQKIKRHEEIKKILGK